MLSIFGVCPITFLKTFFEIVEGGLRVNFKVINDFIALLELLEDVRTIHKISYCFLYILSQLATSIGVLKHYLLNLWRSSPDPSQKAWSPWRPRAWRRRRGRGTRHWWCCRSCCSQTGTRWSQADVLVVAVLLPLPLVRLHHALALHRVSVGHRQRIPDLPAGSRGILTNILGLYNSSNDR